MSSPLLEAIRQRSGGRIDASPPIETPDDFARVTPEGEPRARKRTVEIDDDLTDALRAANRHLETVLETGEIPDGALPELATMSELLVRAFEASGAGGPAGGQPAPGPGQGASPEAVQDLPLL